MEKQELLLELLAAVGGPAKMDFARRMLNSAIKLLAEAGGDAYQLLQEKLTALGKSLGKFKLATFKADVEAVLVDLERAQKAKPHDSVETARQYVIFAVTFVLARFTFADAQQNAAHQRRVKPSDTGVLAVKPGDSGKLQRVEPASVPGASADDDNTYVEEGDDDFEVGTAPPTDEEDSIFQEIVNGEGSGKLGKA
ncbi:MAG TPA: hypothetical protein PLP17_02440 [Oligoflexia bacterium]|nr:hypothetical protein [Oligoflexia bacterium]